MPDHRIGPTTERLMLRALTVEDADDFFALNCHPEVMRYAGEPPLPSLESARAALANYPDFDTTGYGRWGCELKSTDRVIGFCGLKYLDDLKESDVGYRLLPEYWGARPCYRSLPSEHRLWIQSAETRPNPRFGIP